jgi:2-polyprenyl-6-hydroxyphenyl methylase/3-demethylubiquinone-9 3-methyltransferase
MGTQTCYYDRYWTDEGFLPVGRTFAELRDFIVGRALPGQTWLDVGCGDGLTSGTCICETGADYVGVDVSTTAVDRARRAGFAARVIDDSGDLPFETASFDAAVSVEVLEHLFAPQETAREILRVLKPGGVLFATVPNVVYWRRRAEVACGRFDPIGDDLSFEQPWRDPHIRFFSVKTLGRMLAMEGYTDITVRAHAGKFLADLPRIGPRITERGSGAYRALERSLPSLLGKRLNVTAFKPD